MKPAFTFPPLPKSEFCWFDSHHVREMPASVVDRDPGDEQRMRIQFVNAALCQPRTCCVCFTINSSILGDTSRCRACKTALDEPLVQRTFTREEVLGR